MNEKTANKGFRPVSVVSSVVGRGDTMCGGGGRGDRLLFLFFFLFLFREKPTRGQRPSACRCFSRRARHLAPRKNDLH